MTTDAAGPGVTDRDRGGHRGSSAALSVALSVVLGLVVNELSDISPALGRWLMRKAARLQYGATTRAEIRAEQLEAVVNDRPGKLFKVATALRFLASALAYRARRLVGGPEEPDPGLLDGLGHYLVDEASALVARYLFPTERFRGEWRRHWISPLKSLLTGTLMAGLAIAATWRQINHRYAGWFTAGIVVC